MVGSILRWSNHGKSAKQPQAEAQIVGCLIKTWMFYLLSGLRAVLTSCFFMRTEPIPYMGVLRCRTCKKAAASQLRSDAFTRQAGQAQHRIHCDGASQFEEGDIRFHGRIQFVVIRMDYRLEISSRCS